MNRLTGSLISTIAMAIGAVGQAQEFHWPDSAPDDWILAFVDVETTGLTPGHHEMIDFGVVLTDLDGRELGKQFLRIQPNHPERTDAGARAVNAFDEARWREMNALSPAAAVAAIAEFNADIASGRHVLMVAFNSHFDASFIDHLFRDNDRDWRDSYHYFILDLPSMAWSLGLRGLTGSSLAQALEVEDEPHVAEDHTGITGAELNARIYRALLTYREMN